MERKIGEIFEHNGEWYQCIPDTTDNNCNNCFFQKSCSNITGDCSSIVRSDGKSVAFKKLEKVREPFYSKFFGKFYQMYKTYIPAVGSNFKIRVTPVEYIGRNEIFIEIKQNKEDMEEKKVRLKREDIDFLYNKLIEIIEDCVIKGYNIDNVQHEIENLFLTKDSDTKLNLKPFDLEAAKQGKPVCTRDGRKARIICFDRRLFYKNVSYPILALVERSDGEDDVCGYNEKGKVLIEDGAEYKDDLMMLPEKKEGWVNVYKKSIYKTKEEAFNRRDKENYLMTIKVDWEE